MCRLCLTEAYHIIFTPGGANLNKRDELFGFCKHKWKNLLSKQITWKCTPIPADYVNNYLQLSISTKPIVINYFVKHVSLADESWDSQLPIWNKFVREIYMFFFPLWLVETCVQHLKSEILLGFLKSLSLTKNLSPKKFGSQKHCVSKILFLKILLWAKNFGSQKMFGPKKMWVLVWKTLCPKKSWVQKNFGSKEFWVQRILGLKEFWVQKNFASKNILAYKFGQQNDHPVHSISWSFGLHSILLI